MSDDYLAIAERLIVSMPQYKDGGGYVPDYIQLGIGQQLRRIADALQGHAELRALIRARKAKITEPADGALIPSGGAS